jgi:hypothetical protein
MRVLQHRKVPGLRRGLPRGPCLSRRTPTADDNHMAVAWGARWNKAAAGWPEGGKERTWQIPAPSPQSRLARGDTVILCCHWLPLAAVGCHCLGICTVILLALLSSSVKTTVSPRLVAPVRPQPPQHRQVPDLDLSWDVGTRHY